MFLLLTLLFNRQPQKKRLLFEEIAVFDIPTSILVWGHNHVRFDLLFFRFDEIDLFCQVLDPLCYWPCAQACHAVLLKRPFVTATFWFDIRQQVSQSTCEVVLTQRNAWREREREREKIDVAPNSPDLNPINYAVWGAFQVQLYQGRKFNTVEELKQTINTEWKTYRNVSLTVALVNGVVLLNVLLEWRWAH